MRQVKSEHDCEQYTPIIDKCCIRLKAVFFNLPNILSFNVFLGYLKEQYVSDVEDSVVLVRPVLSSSQFITKREEEPALYKSPSLCD